MGESTSSTTGELFKRKRCTSSYNDNTEMMHTENEEDCHSRFPSDCVRNVIKFLMTSPRGACRSATISREFWAMADSDLVWQRFIPNDLQSILDHAEMTRIVPSSKKELFLHFSDHEVFLDGGVKSFRLDKPSGAKIYFLSARALSITWSNDSRYWEWIPNQNSRFSEVAKLLRVCWFDVRGQVEHEELSCRTNYGAYFVFKLRSDSRCLTDQMKASLSVGLERSEHAVCLKPMVNESYENVRLPQARADGWMEVKLGEFYNDIGDNGLVFMRLWETNDYPWKEGLIVEGIEIRPEPL